MVEGRVGPDRGVVAQFASRGESRGRVRGVARARVILLVARITQG